MAMGPQRWLTITESPFPWEREALEFLRAHLPDRDPWYAWSNVEFIDDEGKVNEVDALVLSPHGLFLVEIKSRPGRLDGDAHSWTWTTDGRRRTDDNPLILANRKAKRLKGLLQRQNVVKRLRLGLPYVPAVIFLSADGLDWQVDPSTALSTFGRRPSRSGGGIINALNNGLQTARPHPPITAEQANMVRRAIAEAGIRPSLRDRRIGDYELKRILAEGDGWQDWEGRHVTLDVARRIRLYPYSSASDEEARRALGRMAVREFQVLEGIDHPGLLRVRDYRDTERGPALIFDHDPRAIRLDLLMRDHLDRMGAELRLHIIRQLAETLKYAHGKRLFHRALSPHSILVRDVDQPLPRLQIMNWQTAAREASAAGTTHATTGTSHLDSYVEDPAKVYIAPEALSGGPQSGPHHDVFSLAAIAYHLFTGQPPAPSPLELAARLRSGSGLLVSDVVDGAMQSLVDLIRIGTHPEVPMRIASMDEFLERLAEVERDLQRGTPETTVDPSSAKPGERLEGGFTVVRRLGRGASADALLVQPDGEEGELVLKVALDPAHNDRLEAEAAALGKLHHTNIVSAHRTLTVAGRTAILMESAGPQTLAQLLRTPGGLSLDLKRRFGEELLSAVDHLEQKGVAHRDIKPDNIGITEGKERRRLVLFDFSLARTSPDNIQAGTRPYLDPFLVLRRPPRWDLSAERFAAAVTLHEMMTGLLPSWGDGQSDAAMIDDEATIASDRIDPHLREGLTAFFDKALRRTPRERFDNAEDMQRAWRRVFDEAVTAPDDPDGFDAIARRVTAATPIADLGYSVEAQDVLDRMGVHSVRDLLEVPRRNIRLASGVGDRIRKEIRLKAKRLAQLRQDLVPGTPAPTDLGAADTDRPSIDRLAEMLIPRRPLGEETTEDQVLAVFLGLETAGTPQDWPSVGEVASRCGIARTAVAAALAKGRERWQRQKALGTLRTDLRALLKLHGGVMTVAELTPQVLAMRGSAKLDEAERLQLAGAVLRAAIETESALEEPHFLLFGADSTPLVAEAAELAQHARTLGQAADRLAALDPLAPPQRVHEELEALGWPVLEREDAASRPTLARLRALAVAVSTHAALSSKGEIYPRGMVPDRTLRLAAGSLLGPRMLTEEQLRERVRGRYPDAAPLPARPALDSLLEQAGIGRVWREHGIGPEAGDSEPGYYADTASPGHSSGYSSIHRLMTEGPAVDETPDVLAARQLEDKMAYARRTGGFLALTVDPRRYQEAERALVERFPLKRLSLDRLMLDAMRAEAAGRKVDWSLVLRADAADPQSRDWSNLQRLIGFAVPKVEQALMTAGEPVLLTDCGLFARYGLMDRLQLLRDASGTASGPPGLWLLLPLPDGGLPTIGGKAVPVIDGSQWARLSVTWIENAHRAGSRPAA